MKRYFILTLFCVLSILLYGCRKESTKYYRGYSNSFVIAYYPITEIESYSSNGRIVLLAKVSPYFKDYYGAMSRDEAGRAKYLAKCEKYGDNGYWQEFLYDEYTMMPSAFQDRDFVSINVVSNADYDAEHPAGTPLNDVFKFYATSPIKFIKRGYKDKYEWPDYNDRSPYFQTYFDFNMYHGYKGDPIEGLISELTSDDLILLGGGDKHPRRALGVIAPIKEPTIAKSHVITVTFTDDEGRTLSASRALVF